MHGSSGGGPGKKARIEIIPLIDIIFFLLATFIMVTLSMTKNQGAKVNLPHAVAAGPIGSQSELDKAVTLSVNEKGEMFYNKEPIKLAQLPPKLKTLKAAIKEPKVIINVDGVAGWKNVSAVIDEVRKAGISKAAFNTDKE